MQLCGRSCDIKCKNCVGDDAYYTGQVHPDAIADCLVISVIESAVSTARTNCVRVTKPVKDET